MTREARSGLSAESKTALVQGHSKPVRAPGVAICGSREPLGKDASPTLGCRAEEPAHLNSQPNRCAVPRNIGQGAAVAVMDPIRQLAAVGVGLNLRFARIWTVIPCAFRAREINSS